MELKRCPECGVPELITSEQQWLDNGDIVHARGRTSRLLFIETENLDTLFRSIAQIIGTDIEHMVVTAARRAYRVYLAAFIPEEIRVKILKRELDYMRIVGAFFYLASLNGVGTYSLVGMRYEQDDADFNQVRISEPFSVPMAIAAHLGDLELCTGVDHGYTCEVFPSAHQKELSERLWFEPYHHRDEDLVLERCATCGGPQMLSGYQWYPDRGVIASKTTGRRMAIQGSALLDPVFNELEAELGDTVPRAVVEAQRRFTKSGFYTLDDITDEGDFRTQLAFRGLGNLKKLEMKKKGMSMRVENVALPYIVAGLSQGFFEMGFGVDTTIDWELSEEGNLQVEVKPVKISGKADQRNNCWS
jgi:hypothetical protein